MKNNPLMILVEGSPERAEYEMKNELNKGDVVFVRIPVEATISAVSPDGYSVTIVGGSEYSYFDKSELTKVAAKPKRKKTVFLTWRRNFFQKRREQMRKMADDGKTLEQIGLVFGISKQAVYQNLVKIPPSPTTR